MSNQIFTRLRQCMDSPFIKKSIATLTMSLAVFGLSGNTYAADQCNWYGTTYSVCATTQSGWGWENNVSCISRSTCSAQPAPYGIVASSSSTTSFPNCTSAASDPDGDGWGWENNRSCIVVKSSSSRSSSFPNCASAASDPDGDGWGWENNQSCIVVKTSSSKSSVRSSSSSSRAVSTSSSGYPACSSAAVDPDGDGWGWENNQSCQVVAGPNGYPYCSSSASDPDGDGWGWENNQSCIVKVVTGGTLTPQNVSQYMVDKNATAETKALFYNLKVLQKTKVIIGQQDAFTGFYRGDSSMSDIKKTTGSDPGLLGSDFIFITDKNNNGQSGNWFYQQEVNTIQNVKNAYAKGMINKFTWHLREPYKEVDFYANTMTSTEKANAFKSILPGGSNHEWYKRKLDKVASVFNALKGSRGEYIPVIFRPFHEYDGSWFWWGADFATPDEYKRAFRFTVDYLKNTKGIHHVIYALGPDNSYDTKEKYLSRYPGDDYVDLLGMDNYWDFRNGAGQAGADLAHKKLKVISDLAIEKTKLAALTETGYEVTSTARPISGWFSNYLYNALTANNIEISFAMFWVNGGGTGAVNYYTPTPASGNTSDFISFTNKPDALLQNELPALYRMP